MSNRLNSHSTRVTFSRHQHDREAAVKAAPSEFLVIFASLGGHAQASVAMSPVVPALPMSPPAFAPRRVRPKSSIADVEPLSYPLWLPPVVERSAHVL
jgi:hypothetical protein